MKPPAADLQCCNVPNHDASLCTAGVRHLLAKRTKYTGKIYIFFIGMFLST